MIKKNKLRLAVSIGVVGLFTDIGLGAVWENFILTTLAKTLAGIALGAGGVLVVGAVLYFIRQRKQVTPTTIKVKPLFDEMTPEIERILTHGSSKKLLYLKPETKQAFREVAVKKMKERQNSKYPSQYIQQQNVPATDTSEAPSAANSSHFFKIISPRDQLRIDTAGHTPRLPQMQNSTTKK